MKVYPILVVMLGLLIGCGGGGGGSGSGSIPLKRASWGQPLTYSDNTQIPLGDLQGFWIYVKSDNTFTDGELYADSVATASVLTGIDNSTGVTFLDCEYDLRNAYNKNNLNLTDNYYVAVRSVTVNGGVSGFSPTSRAFSFSEK